MSESNSDLPPSQPNRNENPFNNPLDRAHAMFREYIGSRPSIDILAALDYKENQVPHAAPLLDLVREPQGAIRGSLLYVDLPGDDGKYVEVDTAPSGVRLKTIEETPLINPLIGGKFRAEAGERNIVNAVFPTEEPIFADGQITAELRLADTDITPSDLSSAENLDLVVRVLTEAELVSKGESTGHPKGLNEEGNLESEPYSYDIRSQGEDVYFLLKQDDEEDMPFHFRRIDKAYRSNAAGGKTFDVYGRVPTSDDEIRIKFAR